MKVIRVLVYQGPPDWMESQLQMSLPDGVKQLTGASITVTTLPSTRGVRRLWALIKELFS